MPEIIDSKERKVALDPSKSLLIQAPAGSGKTELLIQRYLRLLSGVEHPDQIISITFTRKAAEEMKRRILEALKRGLNQTSPESPHQQQTWELAKLALKNDSKNNWRILDNPNQLKVLTIDSFCASLVKQMPILSLMGGPLDIIENASDLYKEASKRILSKVESKCEMGKRVRIILNHLDNSKASFLDRINQLFQKRDQWMIPFFDDFDINDDKRNYFENIFSKLIESTLIDLHSETPNDLHTIIPIASFAGNNCLSDNIHTPISSLDNLTNLPSHQISDLNLWKGIAELILTKNGDVRKTVNKSIGFPADQKKIKLNFSELLETLSAHRIFLQKLHEVRDLPDPLFSDNEWKVLRATLLLLPNMADTLRNIFSEQGKTDFTEISLAAREALGTEDDPTDLLLYLDHKIQHILVDEYQDISYKQYDLLIRLTAGWTPGDGRTMFIVGDPMQSIYRFRDAEVGLFLKTKNEGLGNIDLKFLTLQTNFRSKKPIVDWINECFRSIFPKTNNQDLGAITYSPSRAEQTETNESDVFFHATHESFTNNEAIEVTNLIISLRNKYPVKSIAILVRARNHLKSIVKQFHERKIPFRAEDIDSLTSRPEIMDLLALMRALTSLHDRVAWLSTLRAPWCGLSLADLHKICDFDNNTPVWELLKDRKRINTISPTGQKRIKRITSIFLNSLKTLPLSNFRDVLEGCWIQLGGPSYANPDIFPDIEIFFEKVSEFLESNELSNIRAFQDDINHLFSNSWVESDQAVQIMTMHKSKGLEFDIVIIPGLEKTSKAEEKRLVYWMPHGDDLLLAPIEEKGGPDSKIYKFLSRFDRDKSDYEALRLLYVAATRTKLQLHLFGQFLETQNKFPRKGSFLGKLWPFIQEIWPKESNFNETKSQNSDETTNILTPKIWRLSDNYQLPETHPSIEIENTIEIQNELENPEFSWAGSGARALGIVMHRYFQTLAEEGEKKWTEERIKELESLIPVALKSQGLPPQMILEETKKGKTMLSNILNHPEGRWILESHKDARCEYSLSQIKNNIYQSRIIDRTFVDENNSRWIIDYKTGEHMGANLEKFLKNEKERYFNQLTQYEKLFKQLGEQRLIKKALYYPMHKALLVF